MTRIFISYRRAASAGQAGRLYDRLARTFGARNVFMDTEDIPAGETFESYILAEIERCDVFLLMLARGTLNRISVDGDNSRDWLFREIKYALALPHVRVVPVLIDGFEMPAPESLPPEIRTLTSHHAVILVHQAFSATSDGIIRRIRKVASRGSGGGCLQWLWNLGGNAKLVGWSTILSLLVAISGITLASLLSSSDGGDESPVAQVRSETPRPTDTAEIPATLEPTDTPQPTPTPRPTDTLTPSPEPSNTPQPTDTLTPSPEPSNTPQPTDTLTPSPEPSNTPQPTATSPTSDPLQAALDRAQDFDGGNTDWEPFVQDFDGVEMVLVPAGCFEMGSTAEQVQAAFEQCQAEYDNCDRAWFETEYPQHTVCFEEPFWIDRYEVSQGQFAAFDGQAASPSNFTGDDLPRENITWLEAQDFCELRGARLPTEAEWEYAARGPDALVYPWGDEFECSRGNFDDETVRDSYVVEGGAGCDGFNETAPVGSFARGASWVGAEDLSGNVSEWVGDWYDAVYYGTLAERVANPTGPETGEDRVLRGGSWRNNKSGHFRAAYRLGLDPLSGGNHWGFRCARSR